MKIIGIVVLVITIGCGGSDDNEAIDRPDLDQATVDAENYDIAHTVCGLVLDGDADKGDITVDPKTNPAAFADEYAEGYKDGYRQPVYDGCLDAMEGRAKNPPGRPVLLFGLRSLTGTGEREGS